MIKVKIDRPEPNTFYVVDGFTVSYADDVLEVLNEDDETIGVFRSWLYAMPADEIEEEPEGEEADEAEVQDLGGLEVAEADFLVDQHVYTNHSGASSAEDEAGPTAS